MYILLLRTGISLSSLIVVRCYLWIFVFLKFWDQKWVNFVHSGIQIWFIQQCVAQILILTTIFCLFLCGLPPPLTLLGWSVLLFCWRLSAMFLWFSLFTSLLVVVPPPPLFRVPLAMAIGAVCECVINEWGSNLVVSQILLLICRSSKLLHNRQILFYFARGYHSRKGTKF